MLGKTHNKISIDKIKKSNKGKNPNKISIYYQNEFYDCLDDLNKIKFPNLKKTTFHRWIKNGKIEIVKL